MDVNPLEREYEPPEDLGPVLRSLAATTHNRHVDLADLVSGLPPEALEWRPGGDASFLAGIVSHILDVERFLVSVARGERVEWSGEPGSRIEERPGLDALVRGIAEVDAALLGALEAEPDLVAEARSMPGRTIGELLIEDLDHVATHVGQAQLTRHLWELAHPEAPRTYVHWGAAPEAQPRSK